MDRMKTVTFHMENNKGELIVKGEINGESEIPFHDDLKFKGIIALLNSVDKKNFLETENENEFDQYVNEMEEMINQIKKHLHFQGKMI
jgi:hypothetical protein